MKIFKSAGSGYLFLPLLITLHVLYSGFMQAQNLTINGIVKDSLTGESLISANVFEMNTRLGTITNDYGYFSLTVPEGDTLHLLVKYVGYKPKKIVYVPTDIGGIIRVFLIPGKNLEEVSVVAERNVTKNDLGVFSLPVSELQRMPAMMGETNVLKTLHFLPGISSGREGSSDVYVRGGSPDQNLYLLDEVPLFYISHYGGFFSIFNNDALNHVKIYKGGFPAKYGGRLSSVIDVKMKEGNRKEIKGNVTLGMLSSKFLAEGPIKKDRVSFMISARKSVLDLLTRANSIINENGVAYGFSFYDVYGKLNYDINPKNNFYFSFYKGDDHIFSNVVNAMSSLDGDLKNTSKWGNTAFGLRWNHILNPKTFFNITLYSSSYALNSRIYQKDITHNTTELEFNSFIKEYGLKTDLQYNLLRNYTINLGGSFKYNTFNPGRVAISASADSLEEVDISKKNKQYEIPVGYFYLENEIRAGKRIMVKPGLHFSLAEIDNSLDYSMEPRLNMSIRLLKNIMFKSSYAYMKQYMHLLTNSGAGMPTDLWVPATEIAAPAQTSQVSAGFSGFFMEKNMEVTVEAYHKSFQNLIEYTEGKSFYSGLKWEDKIEKNGLGAARGIELFVRKKQGSFSGWAGYSFSNNKRKFANINRGEWYTYRFDRRHEFNIAFIYKITDNADFSVNWIYHTGQAITIPEGKYSVPLLSTVRNNIINENFAFEYNQKNNHRMDAYHRLDAGLNIEKQKRKTLRVWNFSIYNVYNRKNPSYYFFDQDADGNINLYKVSEFPFIPSVSYTVKF